MGPDPVAATSEVVTLFEALVGELSGAGYLLVLGSEGPDAPYAQVRSRPERKQVAERWNASSGTCLRFYPCATYLNHLENAFPRLFEDLAPACRPDRPFLVVERWIRYIDLGERLRRFAREHDLNVRCSDRASGETRVNAVRVRFDRRSHQWRLGEGAVEDLLRDPRRRPRSWLANRDLRWPATRLATRLGHAVRAAVLALS